jgi:hypothetical protein
MAEINSPVVSWNGLYPDNPVEMHIVRNILRAETYEAMGFDLYTGIRDAMNLTQSNFFSKIVKANPLTCDGTTFTDISAAITAKILTVAPLLVQLRQCGDVFQSTAFGYKRKNGALSNDLNGTELGQLAMKQVLPAVQYDVMRILLFGDTASADENYDQLNGLFKLLNAAVDAGTTKNVAIANNYFATAGNAVKLFNDVADNAPYALKMAPDTEKIIVASGTIVDALRRDLNNPVNNTGTFAAFQDGTVMTFNGVPIIRNDQINQVIATDFSPSGTPTRPHRMWMTQRDNIVVGTNDANEMSDLLMWYSMDNDDTRMRAKFDLGIQIRDENLISGAGLDAA